jgi:hypothetical protein
VCFPEKNGARIYQGIYTNSPAGQPGHRDNDPDQLFDTVTTDVKMDRR